jgi:hypothetical protein
MATLDPFVVSEWCRAVLLATEGKTTEVNDETVAADAVAIVGDRIQWLRAGDQPQSDDWPLIGIGEAASSSFDDYAEEATMARGDFLIRGLMREDQAAQVAPGVDFEEFLRPLYIAIFAAFDGAGGEAEHGVIHGCRILGLHREVSGLVGYRIAELGIVARIFSS